MRDIVIFGSGGLAREIHQLINDINENCSDFPKWNLLGFLDGYEENHKNLIHNYFKVLGGIEWLLENKDTHVIIAIGNPAIKRKIVTEIKEKIGTVKYATLIHPQSIIGEWNEIGEGTVVCAGTIITTDIKIREHVTLNLDCTVGHDTVVEDYCTCAPSVNLSGNVTVRTGTDIGTGAVVIQGVSIGEWSIIGAGAVVIREIQPNTTSVGNPSKVIKQRETHWQLQY